MNYFRIVLLLAVLLTFTLASSKSDPGSCCSIDKCGGFCAPQCCDDNDIP